MKYQRILIHLYTAMVFLVLSLLSACSANYCGDLVFDEVLSTCACPEGTEPDYDLDACVGGGLVIPWGDVPLTPQDGGGAADSFVDTAPDGGVDMFVTSDVGMDLSIGDMGADISDFGTAEDMGMTDVRMDVEPVIPPELTDLTVTGALGESALVPGFVPAHLAYQVDVTVLVSEVALIPTTLDPLAMILVDGVPVVSGDMVLVPLNLGENVVEVEVRVPSGASETYRVTVTRGAMVLGQVAYIKASNTNSNDDFGTSVALSGDTLAVGAWGEDSPAVGVGGAEGNGSTSASGAVYVFRRVGDLWTQEAYIKASNTAANDGFGRSLAISEDTIVVGASSEDSDAVGVDGDQNNNAARDSGAVYVFRRTGDAWAQEAYLKASNTEGGDGFGSRVVISGDVLAVTALSEASNAIGVAGAQMDNRAEYSGAVYVFRRTEDAWAQEAYLKASNTDAADRFGGSLALFGDTLAIGAHAEDSNATGVAGDQGDNNADESGAVYVFRHVGDAWAQEAYLKASNTNAGDWFGISVSLSGNTLGVGASSEDSRAVGIGGEQSDNNARSSGAVYVFRRSGETWAQEAYIKASNTDVNDHFGVSVAIFGDLLAVGASNEGSNSTGVDGEQSDNSAGSSGAVYLFRRVGESWAQTTYLKASNTNRNDSFGRTLALSEDSLAVGAPNEASNAVGVGGEQRNNSATHAGAVYMF